MLLEDCFQKKTFASFRNLVSKGELLYLSKTEEWFIHNTYPNPKLYVNCHRNQVKHVQLDYIQFLLAINDLNSRYNLFINKTESLAAIALHTIGGEVEVRLDDEVIPVAAVIRYIGPLGGKIGTYFGVEILVRKCVSKSL